MAAGRPRKFDIDEALDKAIVVFGRQGYSGTSISDLTETMGINPPSLYSAFGNKQALFASALDRDAAQHAAEIDEALALPRGRDAVAALLALVVTRATVRGGSRGSLAVQGALASSDDDVDAVQLAAASRASGEQRLRRRLERARREGDLPTDCDVRGLARYFATVEYGLAVQAGSGATRATLSGVVDVALQAWPSARSKAVSTRADGTEPNGSATKSTRPTAAKLGAAKKTTPAKKAPAKKALAAKAAPATATLPAKRTGRARTAAPGARTARAAR